MNSTPPPARNALRTLLVVAAIVTGVGIYAYGWTVTDISLEEPQKPQRQQNVQNALRELFSPNIFQQEYEIATVSADFLMDCPDGEAAAPSPVVDIPETSSVMVSPACGSRGDQIVVQGFNLQPGSLAQIRWAPPGGDSRPREILETGRDRLNVGGDGAFTATIEVPSIRGSAGETHQVQILAAVPAGPPTLSGTTYEVVAKMIETIFLALIATTLSIPISVILSFFAARNLMKPVHMSLGNLLVSVALLPIGWYIGTLLLAPVGQFAANLGSGQLLGVSAGSTVIFILGSATVSRSLRRMETAEAPSRLRSIVNSIIVAIAIVFVLGLIGGLCLLLADVLTTGVLVYVGNFVRTIGDLLTLGIGVAAGVAGAFTVSGIGATLTTPVLRRLDVTAGHVLGAVLGLIGGALALGLMAVIGTQAALLGLLTPIVAAILGAQVLPLLYNRFVAGSAGSRRGQAGYNTHRSARTVLGIIGAATTFYIVFVALNVSHALVEGTLPPSLTTNILGLEINTYVLQAMLIGAVLGAITGGLVGTRAAFPLGDVLYNTTRTILNALRSIEPLIMGLVFVIWVGIGPFAGVLALTLHSIASLGKLYSEQLENIDPGPMEALQSTGANRLQTIMYGAVPQIIPPYIAFTMYRWDINVRMSTIIGFVGGGGIGFLLQQQLNLLRYRDAGVAVLAIAIVVSILDYASASIRERYI